MFEIFLNGTAYPTPDGMDDLVEKYGYSKELSGYISELTGSLHFNGDAYNYLVGLMETDVTAEVAVVVREDGIESVSGVIYLTDAEINRMARVITCEVAMTGFIATIDQNKSIQVFTNVGTSKNGVAIYSNPLTNFRIPDIDNVLANDNLNRRGVFVGDAFRTIIEFMSDGAVTLASNFFDYSLPTPTQASLTALFTGRSLRSSAFSTYPNISFKELFDDMNALYNLAFAYEEVNGIAYVRIEPKAYFKTIGVSTVLNGVPNVMQAMDRTSFPAKVEFGSVDVAEDKTYLAELRFLGMDEEEYHLGGQSNIDTVLSLKTKTIITDPNIIQDILPTGTSNTRYDKRVCAIVMDLNDTNRALMTENPASAGDYYLNDYLTNEKVALRWFDQIPISIYAYLGSGNNGCLAGAVATQPAIVLPKCFAPTDDFTPPYNDLGNNYAVAIRSFPITYESTGDYSYPGALTPTLGGYYEAPISGVYSFECVMKMQFGTWGRFFAIVMNPPLLGGQVAQSILLASQRPTGLPANNGVVMAGDDPALATPDPYNFTVGGTVYMAATQYLGFAIMLSSNYGIGSTIQVFDPLGGRWASFYAEKNYLMQSKMNVPIPLSQWQQIKANLTQAIGFNMNPDFAGAGYIQELSRNLKTSKTEVKLNSPINGRGN